MIKFLSRLALCITATLAVALCGCDDLGVYTDTKEYYDSFGYITFINGTSKEKKEYSVDEYFYSTESREDFLVNENGEYTGVAPADYVYVAIPFDSNIEMDSLALYIKSQDAATVYINVFVTDKIPTAWRAHADNVPNGNASGENPEQETTYDDPNPETRIGEITVHLKKEKWSSFILDYFKVNGVSESSIQINDGQFVLLQIRNNSGVRDFDEETNTYVDPQTGLELEKVNFTMTNLLVRALEVVDGE